MTILDVRQLYLSKKNQREIYEDTKFYNFSEKNTIKIFNYILLKKSMLQQRPRNDDPPLLTFDKDKEKYTRFSIHFNDTFQHYLYSIKVDLKE